MESGHGNESTRENSVPTTDNPPKKIILSDIYLLVIRYVSMAREGHKKAAKSLFMCTLCCRQLTKGINKVDEKG